VVTKLGPLCKVKLLKDKGDTLVVRSPEKIALCHSPSKMSPPAGKDLGKRGVPAVTSPGAYLRWRYCKFKSRWLREDFEGYPQRPEPQHPP
jgi:hypothetical protein